MNRHTPLLAIFALYLSACDTTTVSSPDAGATATSLRIDNAAWNYDAENDIYWQIGLSYCETPAAPEIESLGVYVPGAYLRATDNGDGSYTARVNADGVVSGYTAATAPIVFPVNTPGYSAQAAPSAYSANEVASYLKAGFVYVAAGMRGRSNGYDEEGQLSYSGGAPWGITDLKAAVRYYRYNAAALPGDTHRIFTFGMSGGGAQSTLMGATGDSALYKPYLEAIGAPMVDDTGHTLSDAISGVMAWCPITSLDYADAAYEWNMGQFASTGARADSTWTSALSKDLARSFAQYINELGLVDDSGKPLRLDASERGVYTAGSYYDHLLAVVEGSLNNFLSDHEFPYELTSGNGPASGAPPAGGTPPADTGNAAVPASDTQASSTTYATAADYIASLNALETWVTYDADSNTAQISSLEAFAKYAKNASKSVPAFDDVQRGQAENDLFGNDANDALHFDATVVKLLRANASKYAGLGDWDESLLDDYVSDLAELDALGNGLEQRQNMYNPMYFLTGQRTGSEKATLAQHWRINTGITQGDTASTVEVNLALALRQRSDVSDVELTTVWAQGHTQAERTGDSTSNFIEWLNRVLSE